MVDLILPEPLVTTDWLFDHLDHEHLRLLDASWYLPDMGRNAYQEFLDHHIPNARYADIDVLSDPDAQLPHTLPSPADFAQHMANLGISHKTAVVVYDTGLPTAARVWYMIRAMGHANVAVLDGGFTKWCAENRPTDSGDPQPLATQSNSDTTNFHPTKFDPAPMANCWVTAEATARAITDENLQIVDARPASRYLGEVAEPRPGVRPGHIPTAVSLPFAELFDSQTGGLLSKDDIRHAFQDAGIDADTPIIAYCGSGVTACNIALAGRVIGAARIQVYDGSWSEWGASTRPIHTGSTLD